MLWRLMHLMARYVLGEHAVDVSTLLAIHHVKPSITTMALGDTRLRDNVFQPLRRALWTLRLCHLILPSLRWLVVGAFATPVYCAVSMVVKMGLAPYRREGRALMQIFRSRCTREPQTELAQ